MLVSLERDQQDVTSGEVYPSPCTCPSQGETGRWRHRGKLSPPHTQEGQEGCFSQSGAACKQAEVEAVRLANEMQAEYWSVSAKTGEWVRGYRPRGCKKSPSVALWYAQVTASCAGDQQGLPLPERMSPRL